MKQTRTTLKALTAAYRAVLRHGILCNAIALGLIATAPAMAARLAIEGGEPVTGTDMVYSGNSGQTYGGGIDNYGGTVTETNVTIQSNSASRGGGANNDGTMTLNGGLIGGATADLGNQGGGGGGIANTGTLTIDGTTLQNNVATNYGGGIYNSLDNSGTSAATVSVSNAIFRNNSAGQDGGAIYSMGREDIVTGALNITTSNFFNNSAASAKAGGAIYLLDSGNMTIKGSTFGGYDETDPENPISLGNTAGKGGAIYIGGLDNSTHGETTVTINKDESNNKTIFDHNVANGTGENSGFGGALVHNGYKTFLDLSDAEFTNNSATNQAGALLISKIAGTEREDGLAASINNVLFANNTTASQGGAVWNGAKASVANTEFRNNSTTGGIEGGGALDLGSVSSTTIDTVTFTSNTSSTDGGAIATRDLGKDNHAATLDITGSSFTGNTAATNGGAINNNFYHSTTAGHTDAVYVADSTFATNSAAKGGAIYNNKGATQTGSMYLTGSTFTGNTATGDGGAIFNEGTLTVSNSVFGDADNAALKNTAGNGGGAVYNIGSLDVVNSNFYNNDAVYFGAIRDKAGGTYVRITDSNFVGNTAEEVGAVGIFSRGDLSSVSGSLFEKNKATGTGAGVDGTGALFVGAEAKLTVSNTTFTENESAAQAGAIGTRGFALGNNSTAKLDIVGSTFTKNKAATEGGAFNNYLYNDADGDGYVKVTGSTFTENEAAKGGAIYNHISQPGDTYQGQTGNIYFADSNFTGNIASDLGGAIYNEGIVTVAANTANVAFSDNTANGALNDIYNIGTLNLTALENHNVSFAGGITGSADSIASNIVNVSGDGYVSIFNALTNQTVNNNGDLRLNADLTGTIINNGDGAKISLARDITASGENVMDGYNGALANDITVAEGGDLTINDATFESGDGKLINVADAVLRINDSVVNVAVENAGTLISDPTYYGAEVVNTGTASFTGDVFENGSSLTNSAIVNLNNVEFKSGSSLIGNAGNTLNLVGTGNIFNGSSTGNNVVLASGANYTGTLYDGVVDARNGGIDTITGSVSGGNLYVDANLTSGEVDTFGGTSGATIKGIKLANAGYGTEDKVELAIGEATLANDLNIDGINYYTSVVKDGDNIVFSDKLINESNLYSKLGSWTGGNYIATSADMENAADGDNYMTVGQALSALDTNLKTVSTAGTIAAGQTGFVTGDAVYNAFASQTASAVDLHDAIAAIMATDASANAKRGALGQLLMTGTVAGQTLTAYTTAEAMSSFATLTGEVMSEYDFGWNINEGLQNDLDDEGKYRIDVLNDSNVEDKTVAGAINANTSAISANADAIATLNGTGEGSVSKSIDDAITAAVGENGAVTGAINTALADYSTTSDMNTAISDAITAAVGENGAVTSAINTALEDYSTTEEMNTAINEALTNAVADGGIVDTAIDNAITAAVGENGAVATAINNATKMGADDDDSTSMFAHFDEGASVTEAAAALDTAVSATESDIATLKGEEGTAGSVKNTAKGYADTAENNAKTFATSAVDSLANGAVADNTAALSLLNGDANTEGSVAYAAANAVATANAYTDSKLNEVRDSAVAASNAYTDRRIEDLDKNLSAGVAGAVALSSVAVSGVERGEVSVGAGYGYFNGQSAAAFGATMGLSNRWSVNAGAGISNADVSFRAGTNYKFKLF